MALTLEQVQSVSRYLHFAYKNYSLNNDKVRDTLKNAMDIIDAEVVAQGAVSDTNPDSAG